MAGDTEHLYNLLRQGTCNELRIKRVLTEKIYEQLKDRKTTFGGTLGDCIRTGSLNAHRPGIGIRACDPDAYTKFSLVMDPIIEEYHRMDSPLHHPPMDFGDPDELDLDFKDVDPEGVFIKSTRVRVARSLKGFAYHPIMTHEDRLNLEKTITKALGQLDGEYKGDYLAIADMTRDTQDQLIRDHYLFNDSNSITRAAGGFTDWPTGRGIYLNEAKSFMVWLQEGDHMRIISMETGCDLKSVYARLVKGVRMIEETGLEWARDNRLGFLAFCATNLGCTLRASVHVDLPNFSKSDHFRDFCAKLNLDIRGVNGDETAQTGTTYDISNKRRLGLTEVDAVLEMHHGVKAVVQEEMRLRIQDTQLPVRSHAN